MEKLLKYISKLENTTNQDKIQLYQTKIFYYYNQVGGADNNLISKIGFDRLAKHFRQDTMLQIIIDTICNLSIGEPYITSLKNLYLADDITPNGKNIQLAQLMAISNALQYSCNNIIVLDQLLKHMYVLYDYFFSLSEGKKRIEMVINIIFIVLQCKIKSGSNNIRTVIFNDKDKEIIIKNISSQLPSVKQFKYVLKNYLDKYNGKNPIGKGDDIYASPVKSDSELISLFNNYPTTQYPAKRT